jgi:hypothetical protein
MDGRANPLDIFRSEPRNTFLNVPGGLALLEANRMALATGAALLSYKARNGAFPGQLADMQLMTTNDPFSGGPLRYRKEGEGFIVFSIGPGRRFDGGQPGMKPNLAQAYFRYTPALPT